MDMQVKILVVEDEMIIAAKISMHLKHLGYEVAGMVPRGEEALLCVEKNRPDIVLLDIRLRGKLDGIETAIRIRQLADIPVIFLTANSDEATFNKAKIAKPYAFISKPYKKLDLQRAIELTIHRISETTNETPQPDNQDGHQPFFLNDRIFVRTKERMVKIIVTDILYMQAERSYSRIFTKNKEYLLAIPLKTMEEKINMPSFLRIHRSYIVNLSNIDEVADDHIIIAQKSIPLSDVLKSQLWQRIRTL